MAKIITISWVRRRYHDRQAADFGEAFGRDVEINQQTIGPIVSALGLYDLNEVTCFMIEHMTRESQCNLVENYGGSKAFARWESWQASQAKKRRPKKRHDPRPRLFHRFLRNMDVDDRNALLLGVMLSAPDRAFIVCNHTPDFTRVVIEGSRVSITCESCDETAIVSICWSEEDADWDEEDLDEEEEERRELEEAEDDEEDDFDEEEEEPLPRRWKKKSRKRKG